MKSITLKDIAKALNLSHSTVSRALKGSYQISAATRDKVVSYATAHHYRPNLMAQSLKSNKSRCIGVVLCSIPNSFFSELISGIEFVAQQKDYFVIITQNHESYENEVKNLQNLTWRSVDGLLISVSCETTRFDHFEAAHGNGMPIVFFDRVTDAISTHQVVADNMGGAYEATQHLLHNGSKRIATITSSPHISITKERLLGYQQALEANAIVPDPDYIAYCMHGGMLEEEVIDAINRLMQLPQPPDALFAASDRLTHSVFSILKKMGYNIPGDIAMAGFSNFHFSHLYNPSLTTVKQPAFEMGKTAAELLIELIESKRSITHFQKKILPTQLQAASSSIKPYTHRVNESIEMHFSG